MTRITTLAGPEAVAVRAAREIANALNRAIEQHGEAHLALSGGGTPERTYELLAEAMESWEAVHVWFADERCVPPDDEQSNYRMAARTLLHRVSLPPQRIHRMRGELGPEAGAEDYTRQLRAALDDAADMAPPGGEPDTTPPDGEPDTTPPDDEPDTAPPDDEPDAAPPALDLIVLGIGPDGHVASLFPGAAALDAGEQELCLAVHDSPKPPPERITLSLPLLRAARRCVLIATGPAKADAISAALATPSKHVPASLLRRERLTVIVDDRAAPTAPLK